MKTIQTATGAKTPVRLHKPNGEALGTFHLSDRSVVTPDASGFLIVDSSQVGALAAAGWAVHPDQTDEGPKAEAEVVI